MSNGPTETSLQQGIFNFKSLPYDDQHKLPVSISGRFLSSDSGQLEAANGYLHPVGWYPHLGLPRKLVQNDFKTSLALC